MKEKNIKLYNILFPVWLLIWLPSWLWLLLIPLNYLIDVLVLRWGLKARPDRDALCRRLGWRVCLAGFLSDFIGSALLFICIVLDDVSPSFARTQNAIGMDPFRDPLAVLITAGAVAISAACIYLFDRRILARAGVSASEAAPAALKLAVITAPYLFLLPTRLLYMRGF